MGSLLNFIAGFYHERSRENLATAVLAEILSSRSAEAIFERFMYDQLDLRFERGFEIDSQKSCDESRAVPDIKVRDGVERTVLIIENKFRASLTDKQPKEYLKAVEPGGCVLFVVPSAQLEKYRQQIENRCLELGGHIEESDTARRTLVAVVMQRSVRLMSWDQVLTALKVGTLSIASTRQRDGLQSSISQLERFCEMVQQQTFGTFNSEELQDKNTGMSINHIAWLTEGVVSECLRQKILVPKKHQRTSVGANYKQEESLFLGRDVFLSGVECWIGFFPSAWGELGASPLWITFEGTALTSQTRGVLKGLPNDAGGLSMRGMRETRNSFPFRSHQM